MSSSYLLIAKLAVAALAAIVVGIAQVLYSVLAIAVFRTLYAVCTFRFNPTSLMPAPKL